MLQILFSLISRFFCNVNMLNFAKFAWTFFPTTCECHITLLQKPHSSMSSFRSCQVQDGFLWDFSSWSVVNSILGNLEKGEGTIYVASLMTKFLVLTTSSGDTSHWGTHGKAIFVIRNVARRPTEWYTSLLQNPAKIPSICKRNAKHDTLVHGNQYLT